MTRATSLKIRDRLVRLRLSAEEKQRWDYAARGQGMTLSDWVRRHVEEGFAAENALELQAADERREQERRRQAAERELERDRVPPARPAASRRDRPAVRRGPTVGEALQAADRNRGGVAGRRP